MSCDVTTAARTALVGLLRRRLEARLERLAWLCHYTVVNNRREALWKKFFPNYDAMDRMAPAVRNGRRIVNLRPPR